MNSLARTFPIPSPWKLLAASMSSGQGPSFPNNKLLNGDNENHKMSCHPSLEKNFYIVPKRSFYTAGPFCVELKPDQQKAGLTSSYAVLEVSSNCSEEELRAAYVRNVKALHPDSGLPTADPHKFARAKEAYKLILENRKGGEVEEEEEEEAEIIFDIRHTAPQHRQYLEYGGVGFGTPSQRQKQYKQYRVAQITENVFQHRIQKDAAETEDALVLKDKQQAKKSIISNAIERIVEDMIQESMKRGDFNDLPGAGKPLPHEAHNPFLDVTTHNLNKMMVNNGFAPEWIMLQSEIRKEMIQARQALAVVHNRVSQQSHSSHNAQLWKSSLSKFNNKISEINIKINKFNLIVPFLNKQKMHYRPERELKRVLENIEEYLPTEEEGNQYWNASTNPMPRLPSEQDTKTDWRQVWRDIKTVFKSKDEERGKS